MFGQMLNNICKIDRKATMHVYTIKSKTNNDNLFTIRFGEQGDKPAIIAFKHKHQARHLAKAHESFGENDLYIDKVAFDSLKRRCAVNIVDLCIYNDLCEYSIYPAMDLPDDGFVFHLENNIKYISD